MSQQNDETRKPIRNHLISRRRIREFVKSHPGTVKDLPAMLRWCKMVEATRWSNFADVRETFPTADLVDIFVVFNLGGHKYRLLAEVDYSPDRGALVFIRFVGTHKEYDRLDL